MRATRAPFGALLAPLAALATLAAACSQDKADTAAPPCERCTLADDNNYTYQADLTIGTMSLAEGVGFTIDWSGLTRDIHGADIDPATDVVRATLAIFLTLTPEEIAAGLANGGLQQSDITLFATCNPVATSCGLDEFSELGSSPDLAPFFVEGNGDWLIALTGQSMSMAYGLAILQPSARSADTVAYVDSDTSALDLAVDLRTLTPLTVHAATPGITLDWSGLTRDGLGQEFNASEVNQVLVGRYDQDLDTLAGQAWDLESIAAESWSLSPGGETSADLSALEGDSEFPGVDAESTWLLALRCTTCVNPAPPFLTVLRAP